MLYLAHNYNPMIALDRWLSMLRYGRGVQFVAPSAAAAQIQLGTLRRYGVKTYAYTFTLGGERAYRVRTAQGEWARYLLDCQAAGRQPRAWSEANPSAAARPVGFAGAVLGVFQRLGGRRK